MGVAIGGVCTMMLWMFFWVLGCACAKSSWEQCRLESCQNWCACLQSCFTNRSPSGSGGRSNQISDGSGGRSNQINDPLLDQFNRLDASGSGGRSNQISDGSGGRSKQINDWLLGLADIICAEIEMNRAPNICFSGTRERMDDWYRKANIRGVLRTICDQMEEGPSREYLVCLLVQRLFELRAQMAREQANKVEEELSRRIFLDMIDPEQKTFTKALH